MSDAPDTDHAVQDENGSHVHYRGGTVAFRYLQRNFCPLFGISPVESVVSRSVTRMNQSRE